MFALSAPGVRCIATYAYNYLSALGGEAMRSLLVPPASYALEEENGGAGRCSVALPPCGSPGIDAEEITAALSAPEIEAALAGGETTYGRTWAFESDQGYFYVHRFDGGTLNIGAQCVASNECRPVPESAAALRRLLKQLDMQQLEAGACVGD